MKQVILMRTDLGMSTGKMCAQAVHACQSPELPTIVVEVTSLKALRDIVDIAVERGIANKTVTDAGHTEVPPGTITCASLCGHEISVNRLTRQLPLLK